MKENGIGGLVVSRQQIRGMVTRATSCAQVVVERRDPAARFAYHMTADVISATSVEAAG